jgi:hypothetical protein
MGHFGKKKLFFLSFLSCLGAWTKDLWVQSQQLRPSIQDTNEFRKINLELILSVHYLKQQKFTDWNRNVLQIETVKPK